MRIFECGAVSWPVRAGGRALLMLYVPAVSRLELVRQARVATGLICDKNRFWYLVISFSQTRNPPSPTYLQRRDGSAGIVPVLDTWQRPQAGQQPVQPRHAPACWPACGTITPVSRPARAIAKAPNPIHHQNPIHPPSLPPGAIATVRKEVSGRPNQLLSLQDPRIYSPSFRAYVCDYQFPIAPTTKHRGGAARSFRYPSSHLQSKTPASAGCAAVRRFSTSTSLLEFAPSPDTTTPSRPIE